MTHRCVCGSLLDALASAVAQRVVEQLREPSGALAKTLPEQPPAKYEAPKAAGPEYLSTAEAAALLGMTVKGLEGMRAKGTGPKFFRVGGRIRYRRSDLTP